MAENPKKNFKVALEGAIKEAAKVRDRLGEPDAEFEEAKKTAVRKRNALIRDLIGSRVTSKFV